MKNLNRFIIPLWEKIQSLTSNKKILMLIAGCSAGFLLLVLLLVISIRMNHNRDEIQSTSPGENQLFAAPLIEPEELFLPTEPDLIPNVILDREPKASWTEEDAEQFWNDPLNEDSDVWRNRIFNAVDDMMENVP
jgi:hypothetical protein